MAHYDADGEVKPYIRHYVEGLRTIADRVVFLSTAPDLDPAPLERLCDPPILLENRGYDFGMWKHALERIDLDGVEELILTNSSVYGPVGSLADTFRAMDEREADFWGMTASREHAFHIQSYFLVLRRTALDHPAFRAFFASVLPYRNKWQLIRSYELGFTTFLEENGLRPATFIDRERLLFRPRTLTRIFRRTLNNPTLFHPLVLLELGMPLVKVEVFRDNPARVSRSRVASAMKARGYPVELIHVGR